MLCQRTSGRVLIDKDSEQLCAAVVGEAGETVLSVQLFDVLVGGPEELCGEIHGRPECFDGLCHDRSGRWPIARDECLETPFLLN